MKKLLVTAAVLWAATGTAQADFVINDDLIVDGSACVGFDCVNGESFGYDTIRLKEHNLRIKFDDTSTASSFPRNDWQITVNESANGGRSKFSIDDISGNRTPFTIEANARSHSLYVDDGGRIGIRTSTPSTEIHVIDGDTPTLRLQQDGSSGFAPQTWDVAGNETNFFVRDVTNGSTLPVRLRPGAPTSSIDIAADGDVGIGTASPQDDLDVYVNVSSSAAEITGLFRNGSGPVGIELRDESQTGNGGNDGKWYIQSRNQKFGVTQPGTGVTELELDNSGNLSITGNFVSGGVTLTVPDYVFEPQYQLMSMQELAAFVEREKRLPNVPSARDLKANGVNMTEMQMRLLEKVEELTLYTLAQERTIQDQRDTITAQQAGMLELGQRLAAVEERAGLAAR